jgi:hypothetical protein
MDVALPCVGICGVDAFAHQPRERIDLPRIGVSVREAIDERRPAASEI